MSQEAIRGRAPTYGYQQPGDGLGHLKLDEITKGVYVEMKGRSGVELDPAICRCQVYEKETAKD